jgi:hypothetical protein
MSQITQSILHDEIDGRYGNCLQAAVASLLDFNLSDVPHFAQYDNADYPWLWYDALVGWAYQRGMYVELYDEPQLMTPNGKQCLLGGESPRGVQHVCVGFDHIVTWDPHPSRSGLKLINSWITIDTVRV